MKSKLDFKLDKLKEKYEKMYGPWSRGEIAAFKWGYVEGIKEAAEHYEKLKKQDSH